MEIFNNHPFKINFELDDKYKFLKNIIYDILTFNNLKEYEFLANSILNNPENYNIPEKTILTLKSKFQKNEIFLDDISEESLEGTKSTKSKGTKSEGTPDGTPEGAPEETIEETYEEFLEGTKSDGIQGIPKGNLEGTPDGTPEENLEKNNLTDEKEKDLRTLGGKGTLEEILVPEFDYKSDILEIADSDLSELNNNIIKNKSFKLNENDIFIKERQKISKYSEVNPITVSKLYRTESNLKKKKLEELKKIILAKKHDIKSIDKKSDILEFINSTNKIFDSTYLDDIDDESINELWSLIEDLKSKSSKNFAFLILKGLFLALEYVLSLFNLKFLQGISAKITPEIISKEMNKSYNMLNSKFKTSLPFMDVLYFIVSNINFNFF